MPKKNMTPEERKAIGARLKAGREAKKAQIKKQNQVNPTPTGVNPDPTRALPQDDKVTLTQEQFQEMMNRISDLESQKPQPQAAAPYIGESGQAIGVKEKASVNPDDYRNPVEALYNFFEDTPKYRRLGVRDNYEIRWSVNPTRYQTAFGTWFVEPRFELTLLRRRFDEDGNETPSKVIVGRSSFFEDLPANLLEAELAGLSVDDVGKPEFADKMRMYRYTTWLIEKIQPKRPGATSTKKKKLEVIGGTAYEVEEGSELV